MWPANPLFFFFSLIFNPPQKSILPFKLNCTQQFFLRDGIYLYRFLYRFISIYTSNGTTFDNFFYWGRRNRKKTRLRIHWIFFSDIEIRKLIFFSLHKIFKRINFFLKKFYIESSQFLNFEINCAIFVCTIVRELFDKYKWFVIVIYLI